MWNLFGKRQYFNSHRIFGGSYESRVMCATPPGTQACDAEGGAFSPKWREGRTGESQIPFPSSTTIASHRPVSMRH
jgi:hypothetical protein